MDFYKRKIIKKIKYHGLVITIVAIIVAISNCGKKELLEPSLETVLENYHENTLLDEIINLSNKQSETEATIENINKLEQRLKIIEKIENLNISNETNISKIQKEKYLNLTEEEIINLIELVEQESTESIQIKECLYFIKNEYKKWITETGIDISKDLMEKAIKQAACQMTGLKQEYYYKWNITSKNDYKKEIEYNDLQTKEKITYELNGIYLYGSNILSKLENINTDEKDYSKVTNYCIEILNYTKLICTSGVISNSDILKPAIGEKKAKEKIIILSK